MRILIAQDEHFWTRVLARVAQGLGHECLLAEDGPRAWEIFQRCSIDVVIAGRMAAGISGLELCRKIREYGGPHYPYVILVSAPEQSGGLIVGMEAGADHSLVKPILPEELQAALIAAQRVSSLRRQLVELERMNREFSEAARTDPLTELGNRRRLREDLEALRARVDRYGHSYCIALCDLDCFKPFNDTLGHLAGDEALRTVAKTIVEQCRSGDGAYRYGGEEFAIIFPGQSLDTSFIATERIRREVEQLAIWHPGKMPPGVLTVSAGIAALAPDDGNTPEEILGQADAALYLAKECGRNQVRAACNLGAAPGDATVVAG